MLVSIPFIFSFDACPIDHHIFRTVPSKELWACAQRSLATAKGAEGRHGPVHLDQLNQAYRKALGVL